MSEIINHPLFGKVYKCTDKELIKLLKPLVCKNLKKLKLCQKRKQ